MHRGGAGGRTHQDRKRWARMANYAIRAEGGLGESSSPISPQYGWRHPGLGEEGTVTSHHLWMAPPGLGPSFPALRIITYSKHLLTKPKSPSSSSEPSRMALEVPRLLLWASPAGKPLLPSPASLEAVMPAGAPGCAVRPGLGGPLLGSCGLTRGKGRNGGSC